MKKLLNLSILGVALAATPAFGATIVTYYGAVGGAESTAFNNSAIVGGSATFTETFDDGVFTNFTLTNNGSSPNGFTRTVSGGERKTQVAISGAESETIAWIGGNLVAVGGDFDLSPGSQGQFVRVTLTFADTSTQTLTEMLGKNGVGDAVTPFFFGFTSDTEFVSFTLSAGDGGGTVETFDYDNLRLEQALAEEPEPEPEPGIPEPSTFGLMGIAMVGLGLIRRVRR